ncbi:MAG: hypothetical protein F6J98_02350 [Moorea sp. SIO4G2]|nr:hypothetical protein [Moorena sp. SIO4G2]
MPYQQEYFRTVLLNQVTVVLKARQTGFTFTDAIASVWMASQPKNSQYGSSQLYVSYNFRAAREYIALCAEWAKKFQMVCSEVQETIYHDEGKDLLAFRLQFASGHYIEALPSKPKSFRGRRASVCIDEACYIEELEEMLRAIFAFLIWGGTRIRLISTPYQIGDAFYKIIEQIKAGEKPYALVSCPFDKAADYLYPRVCLLNGQRWTAEGQKKWMKEIIDLYSPFEGSELFCQFIDVLGGNIFKKEHFRQISWDDFDLVEIEHQCVSFDIATTEKELGDRANDPFYTFGVHMVFSNGCYYIVDVIFDRVDAKSGDEMMREWILERNRWAKERDGRSASVPLLIEQEPGSSGKKYIEQLRDYIPFADIIACPPKGRKLIRALPFRNTAAAGKVYMLPFSSSDRCVDAFVSWRDKPLPFISDLLDATSQAYNWLMDTMPMDIPVGTSRIWTF